MIERVLAETRSRGLLAVIVLALAAPAMADLSGFADVAGNRTDTEGIRRESLRQEYNLNWSHDLTPWVDLRAAVRYYKFDQDVALALSTFQEEFQPLGEIIWRHPIFTLTASGYRRKATATAQIGNITTDNFLASFKTQDQRYPILGIRYDWQHVFDTIDGYDRDVDDERLQLTADYLNDNNTWNYTFNNRVSENIISDLESTRREHVARWFHSQSNLVNGRMDLQFNYNFNYAEQLDKILEGDTILERIPIAAGLYALDDSPDLGALEPVPGLTDGNTTAPTVPPINIGGATTGRNIGADLGFERPVASLYLYTDRITGVQPTWRIFISQDNLDWTPWSFTGPEIFNSALNRYEFAFPVVTTRYIKVVKDGVSAILDVLVTEIEALQQIEAVDQQARYGRVHYADARIGFDLTDRITTSLDGSYGYESAGGPTGDRNSLDYAFRAFWQATRAFSHQFRWTQSFTNLEIGEDQRDDVASYTLLYEPRETILASAGALTRWGYLDEQKDLHQRNAFIDVSGRPYPRLNTSVGGSISRNESYLAGTINDVGTLRGSLDGRIASWLDLGFSYTYQDFSGEPDVDRRLRRSADLSFNWRVSRTIFARGRVSRIRDIETVTRQNYLVSWNILPRLSLTGQVFLDVSDDGRSSERYSANATYELASRSMIYFRWNQNDLTEAGGFLTEVVQLGLRIGF